MITACHFDVDRVGIAGAKYFDYREINLYLRVNSSGLRSRVVAVPSCVL